MQPRFRLMCVIITQPRTQHLRIKLATLENLLFKPNNWFAQGIGTVDTTLIVFFRKIHSRTSTLLRFAKIEQEFLYIK